MDRQRAPLPSIPTWSHGRGTSQNTRLLAALLPSHAPVDARTEAELLVWVQRCSGLINFFDRDCRLDGDWRPFFDSQPLVQYALIACRDLEGQAAAYRDQITGWQTAHPSPNAARPGLRETIEGNLLTMLYALCQRVNGWQRFFAGQTGEKVFAGEIAAAIELVFAGALAAARRGQAEFGAMGGPIRRTFVLHDDTSGFDPVLWRLDSPDGNASFPDGGAGAVSALPDALWAAHGAEQRLVKAARTRLEALQAQPQKLAPHLALYLSFARQFAYAQERLNGLTGRHLDLFYRTVLEERPAPPVPDRAWVAFGSAAKSGRFQLPAGSVVGQGQGSQALAYRLLEPVELSGCVVARAVTLSLRVSPPREPAGETGFSTEAIDLAAHAAGAGPGWLPFGRAARAGDGGSGKVAAPAGFAVASPYLDLREGKRSIWLHLRFAGPPEGKAGPDHDWVPLENTVVQCAYSGPAAWVTPSGGCQLKLEDMATIHPRASIEIRLSSGDPPCVDFGTAKLAGNYPPDWPVLRVLFDNPLPATSPPESAVDTFLTLLGSAPLRQIQLSVQANGVHRAQLANGFGVIPPGGDILPFGSLPQQGSSFYIGYPELFRKRLDTLALRLRWSNLPWDPEMYPRGLRSYYRAYIAAASGRYQVPPAPAPASGRSSLFRRGDYQVTLAYLMGGTWHTWTQLTEPPPSPDATGRYPLFPSPKSAASTADSAPPSETSVRAYRSSDASPAPPENAEALPTATIYRMDGWEHATLPAPTPAYRLPAAAALTPQGTTGWLRIQLAEPAYMFGQSMLPGVAAAVATWNAFVLMELAGKGPSGDRTDPAGAPAVAGQAVDAAAADAIVDRWKVPLRAWRLSGFIRRAPLHRWPAQLFVLLRSDDAPAPELPAAARMNPPIQPAAIATAVLGLEGQTFTDRPAVDKHLARGLGFASPLGVPGLGTLLLAVYGWIDGLLSRDPGPGLTSGPASSSTLPPPNPPLVPALSQVRLHYRATTRFHFDGRPDDEPGGCFQILPFATRPFQPGSAGRARLLEPLPVGGWLYLGLTNVTPPQTLTLLIVLEEQISQGPRPQDDLPPPPVWSCLTRDGWTKVSAFSHRDETFGWQKSGLVTLSLPTAMDARNPEMPAGYYWLRAFTPQPDRYPRIRQILTQAGEVEWTTQAPTPEAAARHARRGLPAATLQNLAPPDPRVSSVTQPLPSFGGRPAETETEFRVRLSERLRHKGRAWTAWDYERLLLQQYPEIFYACCLPHTRYPEHGPVPGHVLVVVLPTVRMAPSTLPPGFPDGDLLVMEEWLRRRASPSVQIRVSNPVYETLQISAEVAFRPGQAPDAARQRLNDDLRGYISPWIYQPATVTWPPVEFQLARVREFIAARPYVQSVRRCKFSQPGGAPPSGWLRPQVRWSLFITAASHVITPWEGGRA